MILNRNEIKLVKIKRNLGAKIALIALVILFWQWSLADNLTIAHLDIGQGDATLIWSPSGQTLLVDSGYDLEPDVVQSWLQSHGIADLDYTIATHYHADHIGEFVDMFNSGWLPTTAAYDRGDNPGYTTQTYNNYIAAAAPVRQTIASGEVIDLGGGVTATAVCVNGVLMNGSSYSLNDENERSICVLVEYGNFRYVVAGDLGGGSLGLYDLETPCSELIGDINVFQLNHHGSNSSTNSNWLNNLQAEAAVVSLGDTNPYGYVHTEVISRINANPDLQALYHTEEGYNLSNKSVIVNDHVILETDGLTFYTVDGDIYDLGPDIFLDVWVDPSTVLPIPASGGTLYWNLMVTNQETTTLPVNIKFWLEVPAYGAYTLIDLPGYDLPPLPGGAVRERQTEIPAGAPGGVYELVGEIRDEDDIVLYAADRDTFYKESSETAFDLGFFTPTGWGLPGGDLFPGDSPVPEAITFNAYPQPFNAEVTLSFALAQDQRIRLDIYDIRGGWIKTLADGKFTAGEHRIYWLADNLSAGIYIARMSGDRETRSVKLVYLK
jgi:beta-lactamase superfamily II metal-dependent hydrolase